MCELDVSAIHTGTSTFNEMKIELLTIINRFDLVRWHACVEQEIQLRMENKRDMFCSLGKRAVDRNLEQTRTEVYAAIQRFNQRV